MPSSVSANDEIYMRLALSLAKTAAAADEVPVGAVIIDDAGTLIGTGYNRREEKQSALSHAELEAIDAACAARGAWRLNDCTLYVTLEPCLMCAGAIYQARLARVVFGTHDPKAGALGSLYEIHKDERLNHNFLIATDVCQKECAALLKDFFKCKRAPSMAFSDL